MCTVSYKMGWLGLGLDGIRVRHRAPNGANEMNCEPSLRLSVCRRVLRDGRSDLLYPAGSYLSISQSITSDSTHRLSEALSMLSIVLHDVGLLFVER